MTLQMLEYFIAVAKYQNFTKAAQSCFVTQPALSRAIQDLEEEMGCQLLVRTSRSVTLTPAGEICLTEARRILKQCDILVDRVQEAGRKNRKPLRLGYLIYGHMVTFVQCLTEQMPDGLPFLLETEYNSPTMAKEKFMAGDLDILLLPEPSVGDLVGVEFMHVVAGPAYAIFYKNNKLFDRESVSLEELKDQKFVMWDERELPLLRDGYVNMCRKAGFEPEIIGKGEKMGDVTALVALYNGVGFAAHASKFVDSVEFHCVPITDSPHIFGLVCVWHKNDTSPQVMALKQILAEVN